MSPDGWILNAKRVVQLVAFTFAAAAAVALSVVPTYSVASLDSTGRETAGGQTLLEVMGTGYLLVLVIPAAILAVPLFLRGHAWRTASVLAAVLVSAFTVLGMLTIGTFYVPAAAAAIVAAFLPVTRREARTEPATTGADA